MKIITLNLPEIHIKALDTLQKIGLYPSRSEMIRVAIRDFFCGKLGVTLNPKEEKETELLIEFDKIDKENKENARKQVLNLMSKLENSEQKTISY